MHALVNVPFMRYPPPPPPCLCHSLLPRASTARGDPFIVRLYDAARECNRFYPWIMKTAKNESRVLQL